MVSFVILLVARTARIAWRTDRQTDNDKPSTVTLAAHARRGLIIYTKRNNVAWIDNNIHYDWAITQCKLLRNETFLRHNYPIKQTRPSLFNREGVATSD